MSTKSYNTLGYQGIVASEHEFSENLSQPIHYQKMWVKLWPNGYLPGVSQNNFVLS